MEGTECTVRQVSAQGRATRVLAWPFPSRFVISIRHLRPDTGAEANARGQDGLCLAAAPLKSKRQRARDDEMTDNCKEESLSDVSSHLITINWYLAFPPITANEGSALRHAGATFKTAPLPQHAPWWSLETGCLLCFADSARDWARYVLERLQPFQPLPGSP